MALLLIDLKRLLDKYNEGCIFSNALYRFIAIIIGGVAFIALIVVLVFMVISVAIDWTNPNAIQR